MLVDLRTRDSELTGADAENWLGNAGIVCNKNGVPSDPRPPRVTSGLRLGTPAVTTRGMTENEMERIAEWIDRLVGARGDNKTTEAVRDEVRRCCASSHSQATPTIAAG